MSLPEYLTGREATARPAAWTDPRDGSELHRRDIDLFSPPEAPGIRSTGWSDVQALTFLQHLGRDAFQASRDRDFSRAWRQDPETGENRPLMYPVGTPILERCQYAVLTHPQRTAVMVIDIDRPSYEEGGQVANLHSAVYRRLDQMAVDGYGPAWVGVNPLNGKAQVIWLIDPVYAAEDRSSPNTRLLGVATAELNAVLGGDAAFSHRFSRWPLHKSNDPTAYRWHCQHNQIVRLGDLMRYARRMTNRQDPSPTRQPDTFESGRARIEAARESARAAKALRELEAELGALEPVAPAAAGVIDGVRVLWVREGHAARDETAFRHALATGYRLRAAGEQLTDAALIDAYERAYGIAQAVGGDHREPDMPPMRDRLTMARRVRSYVTHGKTSPGPSGAGPAARQTSSGRKALATLGRRGGLKAAERWSDPEQTEYQDAARAPLSDSSRQQRVQARRRGYEIADWYLDRHKHTGQWPTLADGMAAFGVGRETVKRALKAAEIELPRGRRSSSARKGLTS